MNIYQLISIPLLALVFSILDTSFFAFYDLFGSTLISSFVVLIVLVSLDQKKTAIYYGAFCILFLSTFSSLPIYIMLIAYLVLPFLFFAIKQKLYLESSLVLTSLLLFTTTVIFRLLLLPISNAGQGSVLASLFSFPIFNSLFGIVLFVLIKKYFFNKKYTL